MPGIDEHQLITISGNPNGGNYLLGFWSEMCDPPLKYNANASDMTTALEALSSVGDGNIVVYKRGSGQLYDVFFLNDLAQQDVPLIDVDDTGLNRGSVVVSVVTEGARDDTPPPPGVTTLGDKLAAQEEANAQASADLVDQQVAAARDKRMAMGTEPAVPPEKRPL